MAEFRGERQAFGAPGDPPHWTPGNKQGVGTACAPGSRVWFTLSNGVVTEAYFPTVDRPQLRDFEFLFTDGKSYVARETELECEAETIGDALAYRVRIADRQRGFALVKRIIADPLRPTVLMRCKLETRAPLQVFFACNPHLEVGGAGNCAYVAHAAGAPALLDGKGGRLLAISGNCRFARLTCGFHGRSDLRTDLANFQMDWEFDRAENGNVVLGAEIDVAERSEFTIAVSFGEDRSSAVSNVLQSLGVNFDSNLLRFESQWKSAAEPLEDLAPWSGDGGRLFRTSYKIILAHEDKTYQGAFIASLAILWGEARTDQDGGGGYHLVWTRDLVQSVLGLLSAGNKELPLRGLIYLATRQQPDGKFPQNFWIDGRPYRRGMQLDEVAFPVILAHRFVRLNPAKPGEAAAPGSADRAMLPLPARPPGQPDAWPARDIVDAGDLPDRGLYRGRPTGSAMPLVWAHAEYLRLLRSARDGRVFDLIDEVADRYLRRPPPKATIEFWTSTHPIPYIRRGRTLRVCSQRPFRVQWTDDGWSGQHDTPCAATALGLNFADIPTLPGQRAPIEFTLFWLDRNAWEGRNYQVGMRD